MELVILITDIARQIMNEYCKDYDKEKPKKYIIYLDMNNLYGHAMSQKVCRF